MNTNDDFEALLSRQPFRPPRAEWKTDILRAAAMVAPETVTSSTTARRLRRQAPAALLWPSRYAWGSLASVWLVLLAIKLDTPPAPMLATDRPPVSPAQAKRSLLARTANLNHLLAQIKPAPSPWPTPPAAAAGSPGPP